MTQHTPLQHASLRKWQKAGGHKDLPCERFLKGFSAADVRPADRGELSPCFSPHHAAASVWKAKATSRCWILACLLFFSFCFKNSIWLACSQGCYAALPPAAAVPADKSGTFGKIYPNSALPGFSGSFLNFIHLQPLLYVTTSEKLFLNWSFQNNPLPERGKKEAITTTTAARTWKQVTHWDREPEQQPRTHSLCATQGWTQPSQTWCCDQMAILPCDPSQH